MTKDFGLRRLFDQTYYTTKENVKNGGPKIDVCTGAPPDVVTALPEILTNVQKISRDLDINFPGKGKFQNPKFSVPTSREETLIMTAYLTLFNCEAYFQNLISASFIFLNKFVSMELRYRAA